MFGFLDFVLYCIGDGLVYYEYPLDKNGSRLYWVSADNFAGLGYGWKFKFINEMRRKLKNPTVCCKGDFSDNKSLVKSMFMGYIDRFEESKATNRIVLD